MRFLVIAIVLISVAGCPAPSIASESLYFPLQDGCWWEYLGDGGDHCRAWVDGTQTVQGQVTTVLHWQYSGEIQENLYQYYSVDSTGAVLFHGFYNDAGLTASYDPPFVLLPPSLGLGSEWCTTTQPYWDLEGTTPMDDSVEVCFRVASIGQLDVPAGQFTAFGVRQFVPESMASPVAGLDVLGRPTLEGSRGATDWYSENVGEVALRIYQYFALSGWSGQPVPITRLSWGALKSGYLPNNGLQTAGASPRR